LLPLNGTLKAACGYAGVRPGWNTVGCPRPEGLGVNLFLVPTGTVTATGLPLSYPKCAV
jgi:hypothetical protein